MRPYHLSIFSLAASISGYAILGCQSFSFIHNNLHHKKSLLAEKLRFTTTTTKLYGGYDATVINPNLKIEFYSLKGGMCPYAARTQIVLNELGLEFNTIEVSTFPTTPDWYLNINPRGKVPAIRIPNDGNIVVYESAICDEYLCDYYDNINNNNDDDKKYNQQNLMPSSSPSVRARIRLLNDHYDTVVGPAQFTYLMNKDPEKDKELKDALNTSLDVYEDMIKNSNHDDNGGEGGPFLMGESFTLADVHVVPFFLRLVVSLRHYKGYEVNEERFPRLLKWFRACSERESVQAAAPSEERIVEVYNKFIDVDYKFGGLNKN